jgi:predicted nucleic acid-binding protein
MNGRTTGGIVEIPQTEIPRYVLDSTAVINHLNRKFDIEAFLEPRMPCRRFISGITDVEALSKPGMSKDEKAEAKTFLRTFESIDLWQSIKKMAAAIRRGTRMETPDAIIAATAVILNATCLSSDEHLQKLVWPGYTVHPL